ncbi:MAG: Uma2 family endonuclease [Nocardioidaceae bacterium]
MRTVVLGPRPAELDALIARRQSLGLDTFDEVWEGEYHMAPAAHGWHGRLGHQLAVLLDPLAHRAGLIAMGPFNLGEPGNFRVPDGGLLRGSPGATWFATAAMVVEVESPDDETWDKLGFYASHGVDEVLVASPAGRSLTWLVRQGGGYVEVEHSALLGPESAGLGARIDWPPTG